MCSRELSMLHARARYLPVYPGEAFEDSGALPLHGCSTRFSYVFSAVFSEIFSNVTFEHERSLSAFVRFVGNENLRRYGENSSTIVLPRERKRKRDISRPLSFEVGVRRLQNHWLKEYVSFARR